MPLKKQRYYKSLDINKITDNKTFWKTISPLFCDQSYSTNYRITLLKKRDTFSKESKVADTLNKFFSNAIKKLKSEKWKKKPTHY